MSTIAESMNEATTIAEFDPIEAGLQALRQQYEGVVFEVATTKGMEAAKAARLAIRDPRYKIEAARKALKAPLLRYGRLVDSEAARITDAILAIETPIDEQIKAEEARKEAERQARAAAEAKRIAEIQDRIRSQITDALLRAAGKRADQIDAEMAALEQVPISPETHAELAESAEREKQRVLAALRQLFCEAVAREEAEVLRRAEEAAERERRAEEERQRREREAAERAATEQRNRELAAEAEALRQQLAAQQAEVEAARKAVQTPAAAPAVEAEVQPQAAPLAIVKPSTPTGEEIVTVLMQHYAAPRATVIGWLHDLDLFALAA